MKNLILISVMFLATTLSAYADNALTTGKWKYNSYYKDTKELGVRGSHDAWTTVVDRSFVLSCAIARETGERSFRFFIATNDPIHKFGEDVPVKIEVGKSVYNLKGRVSNVYVGNVHVLLPTEPNQIFDDMRRSRRFTVTIPTVAGVYPVKQEFSLMGFTKASLNTITNCVY